MVKIFSEMFKNLRVTGRRFFCKVDLEPHHYLLEKDPKYASKAELTNVIPGVDL